jgi:transcriptional regulator with PAS, ATPase and Fis domain
MRKYARSTKTILLVGETGVGKDCIAREIHDLSPRRDKPYITVPLSIFNENLLESELFGYEKGAFTGAENRKIGIFEAAHGGTLYFPEISDIPNRIQSKLLHFIQYKTFRRVGHNLIHPDISIDVCLIFAATPQVTDQINLNVLRQDFYYRIKTFSIFIPPLRERLDEIEPFMRYFIERNLFTDNSKKVKISPKIVEYLCKYHWPGNIRELEGITERMLVDLED